MAIVFNACGGSHQGGKEEGVIEFETKALDEKHPLYNLAPTSATLKFKKEKFIIEMSVMGMFNTSIIGDSKAKTIAQTVKFLDVKQACVENEQDLITENADYKLNIEETGDTKEIAGLKCHKAVVTKASEPNTPFDVWYTTELGMEDCNSLTPYAPIKGVLMDYRIKKMGLEMHFMAKSYKGTAVADNTFEIPASMKIVSKEEMAKFFAKL